MSIKAHDVRASSIFNPPQRQDFGSYTGEPTAVELTRYFHLDDTNQQHIGHRRGVHNRLGFAVQLCTLRFLGRFLDDVAGVPVGAVNAVSRQLDAADASVLSVYQPSRQRLRHVAEIARIYGYRQFETHYVGLRLTRWLYTQCWTGTDRPILLFERATTWLLAHKVLLPGATTIERFVARLRERVERRVWHLLAQQVKKSDQNKLEALLTIPEGHRYSWFDQLRKGPVHTSGPTLVRALERLDTIRSFGSRLVSPRRYPQVAWPHLQVLRCVLERKRSRDYPSRADWQRSLRSRARWKPARKTTHC